MMPLSLFLTIFHLILSKLSIHFFSASLVCLYNHVKISVGPFETLTTINDLLFDENEIVYLICYADMDA